MWVNFWTRIPSVPLYGKWNFTPYFSWFCQSKIRSPGVGWMADSQSINLLSSLWVNDKSWGHHFIKDHLSGKACGAYLMFWSLQSLKQMQCRRLWCINVDGAHKGCRTQHTPWADGTECEPGKVCNTWWFVPHGSISLGWGWAYQSESSFPNATCVRHSSDCSAGSPKQLDVFSAWWCLGHPQPR